MSFTDPSNWSTLDLIGFGFLALDARLRALQTDLRLIQRMEHTEMIDLSALQADVAANTDVVNSAITLLNALHDAIVNLPVGDQAAIDALANDLSAQTASLAQAVAANTITVPVGAPDPTQPPADTPPA